MWTGGVRVIVPNHKGQILMVKQCHENRDIWMLPGGGVEENETTLNAAKREVLEETGINVEIKRLIWYAEEAEERGQRFVNFFLAETVDEEPILGADPEFDEDNQILREVKFVNIREVKNLPLIYPNFLKTELEEVLKNGENHNPYKERFKPVNEL